MSSQSLRAVVLNQSGIHCRDSEIDDHSNLYIHGELSYKLYSEEADLFFPQVQELGQLEQDASIYPRSAGKRRRQQPVRETELHIQKPRELQKAYPTLATQGLIRLLYSQKLDRIFDRSASSPSSVVEAAVHRMSRLMVHAARVLRVGAIVVGSHSTFVFG